MTPLATKAQRSRCGPEPRREHTNAREITDEDGITWTCIQAFAGLGNDPERADATRVEGSEGKVRVVCTPSGAARSVRIACPAEWETSMQDEQLLNAIQNRLAEPEQAT